MIKIQEYKEPQHSSVSEKFLKPQRLSIKRAKMEDLK